MQVAGLLFHLSRSWGSLIFPLFHPPVLFLLRDLADTEVVQILGQSLIARWECEGLLLVFH
jgi:hypothetical protein